MTFITKDSGERIEYASGMRRDTQEGKVDYTIIPSWFIRRFAELLMRGAEKYGRSNWQLAQSKEELTRFQASGLRHHYEWLEGKRDEDHGMAVVFNIMAEMWIESQNNSETTTPLMVFYKDPEPDKSKVFEDTAGDRWCYSPVRESWVAFYGYGTYYQEVLDDSNWYDINLQYFPMTEVIE